MRSPFPLSSRAWRRLIGIVAAAALLGGLGWWLKPAEAYTNIYPGDYVGPATCGKCHQANYRSWKEHSHSRMNLAASDATVKGDFSGARLDYGAGHVVFERKGADFTMAIYEGDRFVRRHKVTRTVGSLYMQYYIGTQIEGPEPPEHWTYKLESKLPFAYCYALKRWLPEPFLDSTVAPETAYLDGAFYLATAPTHNWNTSCMTCHNTYPYLVRLWHQPPPAPEGAIWQGGFPRTAIRTSMPLDHRGGLNVPDWNLRAMLPSELVTLGISCESCHFGGREHAINKKKIRFVPTSPELTVRRSDSPEPLKSNRKDHYIVNAICEQCHNARLDKFPNGGSAVNSCEATDMSMGACASQIKCTDCHNPHRHGPGSGAPDQPLQVAACVQCHAKYQPAEAALAHSRHSAASGVTCLDCHMPRIVAGLDTVVRSHRISSPTEPSMLANGMPNSCNLCHLDKSINWTLEQFASGWGRRLRLKDELLPVYGGSFDTPLGETWLKSQDKFTRLAVAEAYARSPLVKDPAPFLLTALDDPNCFNRTLALISLQKRLGRTVPDREYALLAPPAARKKQLEALRASGSLARELGRRPPMPALARSIPATPSGASDR